MACAHLASDVGARLVVALDVVGVDVSRVAGLTGHRAQDDARMVI